MTITRRDFLKATTAMTVGFGISGYEPGLTALAQAQDPKADKDYVIKLGYYNCDHMTAAPVAREMSIFTDLGLKVEVIGNAKVPQAMAAGQMDVGYIGWDSTVRAHLKGVPIFIAANNHVAGSYYLVLRNDLYELYRKDPKVLLGKKLALGTDPEKKIAEWVTFARKVGLPAEGSRYETFNMRDAEEFLALKTGSLDGYITCDPWGSYAEFDRCGRIVPEFTVTRLPSGKWGLCCVLAMNRNFTEGHPELAKKMILAHSRAIEFVYTKPVKTAEIFAKDYNVPFEVGLMTIHKKTVEEDRTLRWDLSDENIDAAVDWYVSCGTLEWDAKTTRTFVDRQYLQSSGADDFQRFIKEKVDPVLPVGMPYEDWKKKIFEMDGKKA
jgi:NitT/TauT family transport system substrate-binding protein